uniref:Uncharacterized protein n=1 Tax=Cacopsylla melanoneura TaxID=428564 RepID=A0A8D9EJP5_9HEMI
MFILELGWKFKRKHNNKRVKKSAYNIHSKIFTCSFTQNNNCNSHCIDCIKLYSFLFFILLFTIFLSTLCILFFIFSLFIQNNHCNSLLFSHQTLHFSLLFLFTIFLSTFFSYSF